MLEIGSDNIVVWIRNLLVEVRDYRPWRLGEIPDPYLPPAEPHRE